MFSNSLRVALILLVCGAFGALAQVNVVPILIAPVVVPISGALLLEDNASILLLENGTDNFCLEGGC
jgi:hypothetical protein